MSTTYKIAKDDTLDLISKKVFGSERHARHILSANPQLKSILVPGTNIVIPQLPDYPGDLPQILGIKERENIQIYIENNRFEFWDELYITRAIDEVDTISFKAPFDPAASGYQDLFQPFRYKKIDIFIDGELIITGIVVKIRPSVDGNSNRVEVTGYSLPGVLSDCMVPTTAYPIEFKNLNILDIAKALSRPFGLSVISQAKNLGDNFDSVAIKPNQKIHDFLADLARKRNLIINSTEKGEMRFWQSNENASTVAEFEALKAPVVSIDSNFDEQNFYSHVTGINWIITGIDGIPYTEKNPFLTDVLRPYTYQEPDTSDVTIQTSVKAKAGRMFGNMVTYTLNLSTWFDKNGNLWEPNTQVQLLAPQVFIYNPYNFIIKSVSYTRTDKEQSAVLELVLPGAFAGKIPESLPWDL